MRKNLLSKFEDAFNDLRNKLIASSKKFTLITLTKTQRQKKTKKPTPMVAMTKRKNGKAEKVVGSKERSMLDSQGITKFSGSAYNGKGSVDHGKIRSNKKRR